MHELPIIICGCSTSINIDRIITQYLQIYLLFAMLFLIALDCQLGIICQQLFFFFMLADPLITSSYNNDSIQ